MTGRADEETSLRVELTAAAKEHDDDPASLTVFYQNPKPTGDHHWEPTIVRVVGCETLPYRLYYPGYGSEEGEPFIAYSDKWVYIKGVYDGAEWVEAIPRSPDDVAAMVAAKLAPEEYCEGEPLLPMVGGG